jgi:hypothetical protein
MNAVYVLMLCSTVYNPGTCRHFDDGPHYHRTIERCEKASDQYNNNFWRARGRDQKPGYVYAQCFERQDGTAWKASARVSSPYVAPGSRTTIVLPSDRLVRMLAKAKRKECPALGSRECERLNVVINRKGLTEEETECVWQLAKNVTPELRTAKFWDNDALLMHTISGTDCVKLPEG